MNAEPCVAEEKVTSKMIECENLVKIYKSSDIEVVALQGLDLAVEAGELMAIIGNSGSGKSTLLNMLGGLDRPSAGRLSVDGKDLFKFNDQELVDYKRHTVGFVWQNNARNLLPFLSALENVEIPLRLNSSKNIKNSALELLDRVGLLNRRNNKLHQLSGGEQQRVAIAIALANKPRLLLADEPTGAVDTKTASTILDIFREVNRDLGITIVIVTHDRLLSKKVDRVVAIRDGRVSSEYLRKKSYAQELAELDVNIPDASNHEESHDEWVILDRAGRLQLPAEIIEAMGLKMRNKLKVQMENGRIVLATDKKE